MAEHRASIRWHSDSNSFDYDTFTRDHVWQFEGGQSLRASAAPDFQGNAAHVDPEEAMVAALASCHMLTFLAIASKKKLAVVDYEDDAVGSLGKNDAGKTALIEVVLQPRVVFADGVTPSAEQLDALHEKAHANCFLANSVTTRIVLEPRPPLQD